MLYTVFRFIYELKSRLVEYILEFKNTKGWKTWNLEFYPGVKQIAKITWKVYLLLCHFVSSLIGQSETA